MLIGSVLRERVLPLLSNRAAPCVRVAVLASAVALMVPGVWGHSATMVEYGLLPSGLAAWQRQSLGIYRVCGPLSKLLYALPAHLANVRVDYPTSFDSDAQRRWEWQLGLRFQQQHRAGFLSIFRWSRLLPVLVTIVGGCLICEWSTRLFGAWPGVASLITWCWMPLILGHGSLITSDVIAAVMLLAAARTFWSFLLQPGPFSALVSGFALGGAVATKFSLLVLYPAWALILIVRGLEPLGPEADGPPKRSGRGRLAAYGLLAFAASLVAIDGLYFFQGLGFRLSELNESRSSVLREVGRIGDRPETAWMRSVPLPVPREFVRGLDTQLREGDRDAPTYLLGHTRTGGWGFWYPVAGLFKMPLPALVLFGLALWYVPGKARDSDPAFWAAVCTLVPAAAAAIAIMETTGTGTNAAFRYMIPSIGLLCVWSGLAWRAGSRPIRIAATGLLSWLFVNALFSCPDALGWQNELGWAWDRWSGRPALIGDSLDWGQDLARLGAWVSRHSDEGSTVAYAFGQGEGEPYGLGAPAVVPGSEPWRRSTYVAASVNILYGYSTSQGATVGGRFSRLTSEQAAILLGHEPCDRVGRTIRIYRVRSLLPGQ